MSGSEVKDLKDIDCVKNPKHCSFFKIQDFSTTLLPDPYKQDEELAALVNALSDVVVKIRVFELSSDRPADEGESERDSGSGHIVFSRRTEHKTNKTKCPCGSCQEKVWGKITIRSVVHVLWDNHEARSAKCVLDFNGSGGFELPAYKVTCRNVDDDLTAIQCYTHDLELTDKLKERVQILKRLHDQLYKRYEKEVERRLVFIVSHPHGCPKHISFGYVIEFEEDEERSNGDKQFYRLHYNCPTCPGSSGAPVYSLMRKKIWIMPPHKFHNPINDVNGGSSLVWEEKEKRVSSSELLSDVGLPEGGTTDQGIAGEPISSLSLSNEDTTDQILAGDPISSLSLSNVDTTDQVVADEPISRLSLSNGDTTDQGIACEPISNRDLLIEEVTGLSLQNDQVNNTGEAPNQ